MAFLDSQQQQPIGGLQDVATQLKFLVQNQSLLIHTLQNLFPVVTGTFTMSASAGLTIPNTNVSSTQHIQLIPLNSSAALLQGSAKYLYASSISTGSSFVVSTGNGTSAAGTEQFAYYAVNPV